MNIKLLLSFLPCHKLIARILLAALFPSSQCTITQIIPDLATFFLKQFAQDHNMTQFPALLLSAHSTIYDAVY